jgi:hypothetical protein
LFSLPDIMRIIIAIIAVHMTAAKMNPAPATPVATRTQAGDRRGSAESDPPGSLAGGDVDLWPFHGLSFP